MTDPTAADREHEERAKPQTLRFKALTPSITADDLQASLEWYTKVVGFHLKETFEHEGEMRGAELVAGHVTFVLSQDDWGQGRDREKGQGIGLYLETERDVDEIAAAIEARGGELASRPADMPWGVRAFSIVDPDGFKLVITSASEG